MNIGYIRGLNVFYETVNDVIFQHKRRLSIDFL